MYHLSSMQSDASIPAMRKAWRLLPWLALCPSLASGASPAAAAGPWLFDQPEQAAPLYRARIVGSVSYRQHSGDAALVFACRSDGGSVSMELVFDPKALDFDTDPYEGPGAKGRGPITVAGADGQSIKLRMAGWYGEAGPFNLGALPFFFAAYSADAAKVAQWGLQQRVDGRTVSLGVPAPDGGKPLLATFQWPQDAGVLRRVVTPCLNRPAARR